jgi:hypothetical protein
MAAWFSAELPKNAILFIGMEIAVKLDQTRQSII